ncbi:hypothetical protein [Aureimonas populi]|uniref:Uncharacterized protein n=1 Tax=Aureimonas populi TaxID=1701758 RepID=A0ABW5CNJ0_9HYPH|nr:hypothetical protein [Aureimonas populi]
MKAGVYLAGIVAALLAGGSAMAGEPGENAPARIAIADATDRALVSTEGERLRAGKQTRPEPARQEPRKVRVVGPSFLPDE